MSGQMSNFDADFSRWLAANPDGKFSQFSGERILDKIGKGHPHHTLGENLKSGQDWREAGIAPAQLVVDKTGAKQSSKICDYGCGTLRIGLHLIERQDTGCYSGIDASGAIVAKGAEMIGTEMLDRKRPVLGSIDDKIGKVIAADIDVTFSFNVAVHISPDEQQAYNSNLLAICHKTGSQLLLHTMTSNETGRFQESGWAYSPEQYVRWMHPLHPVEIEPFGKPSVKSGRQFQGYLMHFVRD